MELVKITSNGWTARHTAPAKCVKPCLGHTYVRILAKCVEPTTTHDIYYSKRHNPNYLGAHNVVPDQLYALENGGFLERLTEQRYAHLESNWPKTWWRTTNAGLKVVAKAVNAR